MKGYPRWFLPGLVAVMLLSLVSGCLLVPTMLLARFDVEWLPRLPAALRTATAAVHAADGLGLLTLCGALWAVHMRAGWRRRMQRTSGLLLVLLLLLLAVTSVAVFYAGDAWAGASAAGAHAAAGLALVLPFAWHWLRARRRRDAAFGR